MVYRGYIAACLPTCWAGEDHQLSPAEALADGAQAVYRWRLRAVPAASMRIGAGLSLRGHSWGLELGVKVRLWVGVKDCEMGLPSQRFWNQPFRQPGQNKTAKEKNTTG